MSPDIESERSRRSRRGVHGRDARRQDASLHAPDAYVLACGGLETARLLLASRSVQPDGDWEPARCRRPVLHGPSPRGLRPREVVRAAEASRSAGRAAGRRAWRKSAFSSGRTPGTRTASEQLPHAGTPLVRSYGRGVPVVRALGEDPAENRLCRKAFPLLRTPTWPKCQSSSISWRRESCCRTPLYRAARQLKDRFSAGRDGSRRGELLRTGAESAEPRVSRLRTRSIRHASPGAGLGGRPAGNRHA